MSPKVFKCLVIAMQKELSLDLFLFLILKRGKKVGKKEKKIDAECIIVVRCVQERNQKLRFGEPRFRFNRKKIRPQIVIK